MVFLLSIFISLSLIFGNSYFVYAAADPFISIILSPDSISFHADTLPGTFDSQPVDVTVRSDHKNWSIHCEVIPTLTLSGRTNRIPFERLFINTPYTDPAVDKGAGPGYESMDQPRLVAKSSLPGAAAIKASSLKFRLLTNQSEFERITRVPILVYIPIISLFFKNKKKIVEETEVVVFITPSILPQSLPKSE